MLVEFFATARGPPGLEWHHTLVVGLMAPMDIPQKKVLIVNWRGLQSSVDRPSLGHLFEFISCNAFSSLSLADWLDKSPDFIVVDCSGGNSIEALQLNDFRNSAGWTPVIVISPRGFVQAAVRALKSGATDVVEGPLSLSDLSGVVSGLMANAPEGNSLLRRADKSASLRQLSSTLIHLGNFGRMSGETQEMRDLFRLIDQVSARDTTVMITGESGTGKELVAREIHERSPRANYPFIAINCAAIPETLIESELFGHEKGAFTNAIDRRLGHIELAQGGTLFLDEIGELSLSVQVKLLRFLQEREFHRIGRAKPISVNVRVVTATNRNLEEMVATRLFRQDLLYRINVVNLHIPALRERSQDIPLIVSHCVEKLSSRYAGKLLSFSSAAMNVLQAYGWPGNVRELENVVEALLALSPNESVQAHDLPARIRGVKSTYSQSIDVERIKQSGQAFGDAERIFETDMILNALREANYVQTKAARVLGISRRILKYKMDKLGISPE